MKEKVKKAQKNSFLKLLSSPLLVIFLIFLFCVFLAGFYFLSLEESFIYHKKIPDIDMTSFNNVLDKWEEEKILRESITQEDNFIFLDKFNAISQDDVKEETQQSEEEPESKAEEEVKIEDSTKLTEEDVERLLTETLYDYYKQKEEDMPEVSERATLWEDLGLGNAINYHGYYHQNIIFLRTLMSKNEGEN